MPPLSKTTKKVRRPQALGAYIFAGGFTLGVMKHFDVACHLEESDYGVKTAKKNIPGLGIYYGPENWPMDELAGKLPYDLIYGNPPCSAWSSANAKKGDSWRTNPKINCTTKHFSLMEALRPKFWVWESVTQAFTKGREFVDDLARRAATLGYSTSYLLHNAKWMGLPQVRKRFFMVCHRVTFNPIEPDWSMSFTTPIQSLSILGKQTTDEATYIALFGRPIMAKFKPNVLDDLMPGETMLRYWHRKMAGKPQHMECYPDGRVKGRPCFGHARLPVDRPGKTVDGYALIHPIEPRLLNTLEMQTLCGFPREYVFTPNNAKARANEIARGVCPPVAEWLARSIATSLNSGVARSVKTPTVTLYDFIEPPGTKTDLTDLTLTKNRK